MASRAVNIFNGMMFLCLKAVQLICGASEIAYTERIQVLNESEI